MQNVKLQRQLVKRLVNLALDGFYAFDNDDVESFLDRLDSKFEGRANKRSLITQAVASHTKLFPIVLDVANRMWS